MLEIREEELKMVTGGDMLETADDSYLLHCLKYMDTDYGAGELMFHWVSYSAKVDAAWKKAGITCVTKPFASNRYFKDGKEMTQDLAWYIAQHQH